MITIHKPETKIAISARLTLSAKYALLLLQESINDKLEVLEQTDRITTTDALEHYLQLIGKKDHTVLKIGDNCYCIDELIADYFKRYACDNIDDILSKPDELEGVLDKCMRECLFNKITEINDEIEYKTIEDVGESPAQAYQYLKTVSKETLIEYDKAAENELITSIYKKLKLDIIMTCYKNIDLDDNTLDHIHRVEKLIKLYLYKQENIGKKVGSTNMYHDELERFLQGNYDIELNQ